MVDSSQHATISYNLLLLSEARKVLSALKRHQISAIVLKGVALTELIYPHLGMRAATDIDLLIDKKDSALASRTLLDLGYELKPGTAKHIRPGPPAVVVDCQTGIPYLRDQELWSDLMPIDVDGAQGHTLPVEQNIIYLCYHLAVNHANSEPKWLQDIHRMVVHFEEQIDWDDLGCKIRKYRLEAPCYHTLRKAREVFQSPIPEDFLSSIMPQNSLKDSIFRQVLDRPDSVLYATRILRILAFPRLTFSHCFPARSFMCLRYRTQPPLVYIYYLVRPACHLVRALPGTACFLLTLLKIVTTHKARPCSEDAA